MVHHLTKQEFIDKVFDYEHEEAWLFKGEKPAIIDFYADWCGPCKMVTPILEKIATQYSERLDIYKVDTEAEMELAAVFGIRSIPSILFIPVGKQPMMHVGALPKESFVELIEKDLLPEQVVS